MKCLFSFFFRTKESEAARGAAHAKALLARKPSQEELNRQWSCACEDEAFDTSEKGRAYTRAYKAVLREHVK